MREALPIRKTKNVHRQAFELGGIPRVDYDMREKVRTHTNTNNLHRWALSLGQDFCVWMWGLTWSFWDRARGGVGTAIRVELGLEQG